MHKFCTIVYMGVFLCLIFTQGAFIRKKCFMCWSTFRLSLIRVLLLKYWFISVFYYHCASCIYAIWTCFTAIIITSESSDSMKISCIKQLTNIWSPVIQQYYFKIPVKTSTPTSETLISCWNPYRLSPTDSRRLLRPCCFRVHIRGKATIIDKLHAHANVMVGCCWELAKNLKISCDF